MRILFFLYLITLPGSALAGDPIPGVDVALEQIPGGKYNNPNQCVADKGKVVTKGGVIYCQFAVSHNSTRSNRKKFEVAKPVFGASK